MKFKWNVKSTSFYYVTKHHSTVNLLLFLHFLKWNLFSLAFLKKSLYMYIHAINNFFSRKLLSPKHQILRPLNPLFCQQKTWNWTSQKTGSPQEPVQLPSRSNQRCSPPKTWTWTLPLLLPQESLQVQLSASPRVSLPIIHYKIGLSLFPKIMKTLVKVVHFGASSVFFSLGPIFI